MVASSRRSASTTPRRTRRTSTATSERGQYWLGVGAQPTEAVAAILKVTGDWQKFKGLEGTEGTLRHAEPKRDKLEIFNEALAEAHSSDKAEAVTKKSAPKKSEPTAEAKAEEPKAEEPKAEEPKADEAPAPVPASETPEVAASEAEATEGTAKSES